MKKCFKFFILIIACFLPFMVEAKTNFTYEWKIEDKFSLGSVDGKYLFSDTQYVYNNDDKYDVYDKDGNFEEQLVFELSDLTGPSSYYDSELNKLYLRNTDGVEFQFSNLLNKYYVVEPYDGEVFIYGDKFIDPIDELSFFTTEDEERIKEVLGKEYDVLKSIYDAELDIDNYTYDEDYYVAWCYNDEYDYYKVFDKNGNLIYNTEFLYEDHKVVHVYDGKIYELEQNSKFNIYDLEGKLLETVQLDFDFSELENVENYFLDNFYIKNNNLVVQYFLNFIEPSSVSDLPSGMVSARVNRVDFNDVKVAVTQVGPDSILNLKYKMTNDVTLINAKAGGSYTVERKVDEFDREYIELNITPADGYIVNKIKVTDAYGTEIPVTNYRFYMPGSDVTVEVTYNGGEYLPIPDTGLGKSITLIIIGFILVGLGVYTINYVRGESKEDI